MNILDHGSNLNMLASPAQDRASFSVCAMLSYPALLQTLLLYPLTKSNMLVSCFIKTKQRSSFAKVVETKTVC